MAKRKMTPLALVLTLIDGLNPDEIATLADFLRGKQPPTPRKTAVKKAGKKAPTPIVLPEDPNDFKVPF